MHPAPAPGRDGAPFRTLTASPDWTAASHAAPEQHHHLERHHVTTLPMAGTPEADAAAYVRAVRHGYDGLERWLAGRLDGPPAAERARLSSRTALADAAAWYASRGLPVFPLTPGAKQPLPGSLGCCWGSHRRGCRDASINADAVRHWWTVHPFANIGLATGHVVDVIDVDGPAGWRAWLDRHGWPPVLGTVSTPRPGGVHRYVRVTGRGNGARIAPGVDFRGRGGYVLAPPSWIRAEGYAGRYAWLAPLRLPTR